VENRGLKCGSLGNFGNEGWFGNPAIWSHFLLMFQFVSVIMVGHSLS